MIHLRKFIFISFIFLIIAGCTPRDSSLIYRPEKLEPPVERAIEAETENECVGEDCPLPSVDSDVDDILIDNFDPYGSGEVGDTTLEPSSSTESVTENQQNSNSGEEAENSSN